MTNRTFGIFAVILSGVIAVQIALYVRLHSDTASGTLVCRAENAGIPLSTADASVVVYRDGERESPVARGGVGTRIQVPAAVYDVHVLYAASRDRQEVWLEDVVIERGQREERTVEFSAGQVAVSISVGGRSATETDGLVQIVAPEDQTRVIASFLPGEAAIIRAGTYDLRVALLSESREKSVQWLRGVAVQAGLRIRPNVSFQQGQLAITAANAGKELPASAVALTVFRAGDAQEEVVEAGPVRVPIALAPGRYDVRARLTESNDSATQWIRDVEVRENETTSRTAAFSTGTAIVKAFLAGGAELTSFRAYVYFYRVDDHQQPVAYVPSGETVVLSAGRYDVRAHFFRSHDQPDIWKRGIEIRPGHTLVEEVRFASGTLLIRAFGGNGTELIGDNVFLYVYRAGETVTPAARARSGEEVTLSEGTYDVRAVDSRRRSEERWLKNVRVGSGQTQKATVTFGPD
jgi:hypothetical protein